MFFVEWSNNGRAVNILDIYEYTEKSSSNPDQAATLLAEGSSIRFLSFQVIDRWYVEIGHGRHFQIPLFSDFP
jgi:hypothetical protein